MGRLSGFALIFIATAAGLVGCVVDPSRPDLDRLYETARTDVNQPPVILIPGLMGSRLVSESEGEIWPGSLFRVIFFGLSACGAGN